MLYRRYWQWVARQIRAARSGLRLASRSPLYSRLQIESLEGRLAPATHVWIGNPGAGGNSWATGSNWSSGGSPFGDSFPDVFFPATAHRYDVNVDLLVRQPLSSLRFEGSGYTLSGGPQFVLNGDITSNNPAITTNTINVDIKFGATQCTFPEASYTFTTAGGTLSLGGLLSRNIGACPVIKKAGPGVVVVNHANNSSGNWDINPGGGTVRVGAPDAVIGRVTLASGTTLDVNINTLIDHITYLSGSGSVKLGSGWLSVGNANVNSTFAGPISGSFPNGALFKEGSGTLTLTGTSTYRGTDIFAGTLVVNGSLFSAGIVTVNTNELQSGATLSGLGSLGAVIVRDYGIIGPGDTNPGAIHASSLGFTSPAASFRVRLNSAASYDRFIATGTVNLTKNPALTVNVNFNSNIGDIFPILIGAGGTTGTFANLPDGAAFYAKGQRFQIFYNPTSVVLKHIGNPATHFQISAPGSTQAGTAFDYTITALDGQNNVDSAYTGTVTLSSLDPVGATFNPASHTFTVGVNQDNGVFATFGGGATLYTAGIWDVTAADQNNASITGSANLLVTPAPAVAFQLTAPASVQTGAAFTLTVTAVDPYGNRDTNYVTNINGAVTFTTTDMDLGIGLPPDAHFMSSDAGSQTFPNGVVLITTGDQTITATDTFNGITGSVTVTVTSGAGPQTNESGLRVTPSLASRVSAPGAAVFTCDDSTFPVPSGYAIPHIAERPVDQFFSGGTDGPLLLAALREPLAERAPTEIETLDPSFDPFGQPVSMASEFLKPLPM
jgi:autotransporter-associated beta strand protein